MLSSPQQVSQVLGLLYDAAGDPSLWEPFIAQLARRTRATSAALVIHDFKHACCTVGTSWRLDPDLSRLYQDHYHALDVWAEKVSSVRAGHAYLSEALCPLAELRTTEFYSDLLMKSDIEHAMFAVPESSRSLLASISLYRCRSRSEFTQSDLHILEFLAPHLQRAFKLHFALSEARAHSAGAEAALEMLPTGIVMLGSRGEIVFKNQSAACTIAEKDGLLVTGNQLRAERSVESEHLTAMVESALSVSTGVGMSAGGGILISRRTRPPLQVVISPIRNTKVQSFQKTAAIAFINDPLRRNRPPEAVLRQVHGLTSAECRIALLLSDGHAPRQIAGMLGVTDNTIRSQIKSIYGKTGVKRQSELVRLLLNHAGPSIQRDPIR